MASGTHRPKAKFPAQKPQTVKVIAAARDHDAAVTANATRFADPDPASGPFVAQINAVDAAETVVRSGTKGMVPAREAAMDLLWVMIQHRLAYVQEIGDNDLPNAVVIIKSAAFEVVKTPTRTPAHLTGSAGTLTGDAIITASPALLGVGKKRATYNWQSSIDKGITWVSHPGTPKSTTTLHGLPTLTNILVRVSVTIGDVVGAWSAPIPLVLS